MVNKKGFIKVVEAFLAILMLLGIIFLVVQSNNVNDKQRTFIEKKEQEILMNIQVNNTLRQLILEETEFDIDSENDTFIPELKPYVNGTVLGAECFLKICLIDDTCNLNKEIDNSVYIKEVLITSSLDLYNPRKLRIFCTENV
ncbi:hypothetical protein GW931_00465 [archaeon]|nr:hypothetical protein [archaeon]